MSVAFEVSGRKREPRPKQVASRVVDTEQHSALLQGACPHAPAVSAGLAIAASIR